MKKSTLRQKGFTLVAALLLLLLLSGVAVGLMYLVNGESHMGGSDINYNLTYYAAESGMEQLTASLAALYSSAQSPTTTSISALANTTPTTLGNGINFNEQITWTPSVPGDPNSPPVTSWNTISAGANQGLVAEIVPLTLTVNAYQGPLNTPTPNAATNITRDVEVALIPVFQFGIFADGDISYFAGPNFQFKGRVHTNGSLYLAGGSTLTFFSKVTAYNEIIRDQLENGHPTSSGYTGLVYIPNASGGCDVSQPAPNCLSYTVPQASWNGGIPPAGGQNATWITTSTSTYKGFVANSRTGVNKLTLPFVGNGVLPIEIIRKPLPGELAGSAVSSSRLFNKAQIRVLLADTQNDLHPGQAGDASDIQLDTQAAINVNPGGVTAFAKATKGADPAWANWPLVNGAAVAAPPANTWPLVNGWLRVEYKNTLGNWVGVTNEWLTLGFARNNVPPAAPGANPVHPNAIIILQQLADRNGDGAITVADAPSALNNINSWYPINFFDAREGFARDTNLAGTQCNVNGIMNAVEIDVGNLRRWLGHTAGGQPVIAGSGGNVDYQPQNGYVFYFSDRRGMSINPNLNPGPPAINGEYGFEDVVNWNSANGVPDGVLDTAGGISAEDVNGNGRLDNWGVKNLGDGFQVNTNTAPPNPFQSADCSAKGRQNLVTGARHVLRLIDGAAGNLPTRADNDGGGFTVASENPVYVLGNYNASNAGYVDPHAAAAIIADAVTVLSSSWTDLNDMKNPNNLGARAGNTTWYRMAVAAGKTLAFPQPAWGGQDMGTDGGMHNFLRYVESWGGTLNYEGSLVSLYYSQYATGIFKCCTTVYSPPNRQYQFDQLFLTPANLPPGTPMFQDVVNLSYRQNFQPQ